MRGRLSGLCNGNKADANITGENHAPTTLEGVKGVQSATKEKNKTRKGGSRPQAQIHRMHGKAEQVKKRSNAFVLTRCNTTVDRPSPLLEKGSGTHWDFLDRGNAGLWMTHALPSPDARVGEIEIGSLTL